MAGVPEEIEFEVGELYRNRLGWYKVLKINGDQLRVRYEGNGQEATLTVESQKRIISNMARDEKTGSPIAENREVFFLFVDECNKSYRFGHELDLYREIVRKHRESGGLDSLLNDDSFVTGIWDTLEAWNMNQRGARLTSLSNLKQSILSHRLDFLRLYQYELHSVTADQIDREVAGPLRNVFCGLKVMESKRRIVGVSKTLHFLLPDLVMPIDGTYTLPYFCGSNEYAKTVEDEFRTFKDIFKESYRITKKLALTEDDVSGESWNTSIPKLIDNAIIGWFKHIEERR